MTLIDVIDAARALLNEPLASTRTFPDNTSSFWTDSILITYVNLAQTEIQQEIVQAFEDYWVCSTFLTVSANQAEYTLPTDFLKIRRLEDYRNTASEPIEIRPTSINQKNPNGAANLLSATSWPGGYYLRGNQVVLTDTPTFTNNSAIRMYYVNRLSDISTTAQTSALPAEAHRALVWGVVRMALFQQQSDTQQVAQAEYEKHMQRIRQQAEDRQLQQSRKVVRTYEKGYL